MIQGPRKEIPVAIPFLAIVLLFGCCQGFTADSPPSSSPPPFTLDLAMPGVEVPALAVPPEGGKISLNLIHTHRTSCTVDLSLSPFIGEHGDSVEVKLWLPDEPNGHAQPQLLGVKVAPGSALRIVLVVPKLPNTDKFAGRLIVSQKGSQPLVWKLVLTRSRQGTLILSRQAVTLEVTIPCCFPWIERRLEWLCWVKADHPFFVNLREKSGQTSLSGISARLEQVAKAPGRGFDLRNNMDFTVDGVNAPDFETWPPKDPNDKTDRTIAAGGQKTVGMILHDLAPGEYNVVIRFSAVDSADDEGQKLALTVRVRSSVVSPILCLIAALFLSLLSTKAVGFARQRSDLLKRIGQLKTPWLAEQEPVVPVVWASAAIHQSEKLSRRFLLASPEEISARVEQAEHLLPVLDKIRQIGDKLRSARMPWLVRKRAQDALDALVRAVGMSLSDQHALKGFEDQLAAFGWLDPEKMVGLYWSAVKNSMIGLHAEVVAESVLDEQRKQTLSQLSKALGDALRDAGSKVLELEEALALDRQYSLLKLLWDRRTRNEEFDELNKLISRALSVDIETFFHKADRQDWERIKNRGALKGQAADDKQAEKTLSIRPPASDGPEPFEAYQMLRFTLETGDPELDQTYVFRHGLQCKWTFTLHARPAWWKQRWRKWSKSEPSITKWDTLSVEPSIVQYASRAGRLEVAVELSRAGDPSVLSATMQLPKEKPYLEISESSKFRGWKALRAAEWASWALAGVAAIVTGLTTFYVKNPTFGSFQDYLTLVAWGAGFDQGKNAVQLLRGASTTTPAKPG